jgi:hypothetical protein
VSCSGGHGAFENCFAHTALRKSWPQCPYLVHMGQDPLPLCTPLSRVCKALSAVRVLLGACLNSLLLETALGENKNTSSFDVKQLTSPGWRF